MLADAVGGVVLCAVGIGSMQTMSQVFLVKNAGADQRGVANSTYYMGMNLGHTLGHGVEACSGYTVSHGRAVAIGMTLVTRAAVAFGRCPAEVLPRLRRLLERYGLPDATAYSAQALYEKTLSDKKRSGDTISLVVPIAWGASQLVRIPVSELPAWIERGLGL